ncbi:calmegin [Histomonas meleagridis]|uniref:calmegin n=1 Tax=Histomonas meleagridis TaxID=135588 RepID=UPI00355A5ED8|nr:calmegin [Histomonas meleagridis]KAH0799897.1 calmegin [Histomonas meleagridis]
MLFITSKGRHHYGISASIKPAIKIDNEPLIIQYEILLTEGIMCTDLGIKVFGPNFDPLNLSEKTPYLIKFGPEVCGKNSKVYFSFYHLNPLNGSFEEKKIKYPPTFLPDKHNHLYTLMIFPNNTFNILIDQTLLRTGSLLKDFAPPVNPPEFINDPNDQKPPEWDDRLKIPDPQDQKPDDWDESQPPMIPDPEHVSPPEGWLVGEPLMVPTEKPAEWNDELFGKWTPSYIPNPKCNIGCGEYKPPMISNPLYRGKWIPKMIPNPNYQGPYKPRKVPNPQYFCDSEPYKFGPITGIGFEMESIDGGSIGFNNIMVSTNEVDSYRWTHDVFLKRQKRRIWTIRIHRFFGLIRNSGIVTSFFDLIKVTKGAWNGLFRLYPYTTFFSTIAIIVIPIVVLLIAYLQKNDDEIFGIDEEELKRQNERMLLRIQEKYKKD